MAITENNYTGNGSTTVYPITFDYLVDSDVKVTLNGVATTAFTILITKEVQFVTAPGNLVAIRIYRETDDSELSATFFPGSSVRAEDLNDNFTQGLYIAQETSNKATTASNVANGIAAVANAALPKAGGTMTGTLVFAPGQPTATTSTPGIVQLSTSVASTSQTLAATPSAVKQAYDLASQCGKIYFETQTASNSSQLDFTIPSWTKTITVTFRSLRSTDTGVRIRLGDVTAGIKTTGYTSYSTLLYATPTPTTQYAYLDSETAGFVAYVGLGNVSTVGHWTISLADSNSWVYSNSLNQLSADLATISSAGAVTLSDTINSLRVIGLSSGTLTSGTVTIQCVGI